MIHRIIVDSPRGERKAELPKFEPKRCLVTEVVREEATYEDMEGWRLLKVPITLYGSPRTPIV